MRERKSENRHGRDRAKKLLDLNVTFREFYKIIYIYIYIYIYIVKLAILVEGDSKAQKLLHRGVGEGATPFPGLPHFTLNPNLIILSAKQIPFFESLV